MFLTGQLQCTNFSATEIAHIWQARFSQNDTPLGFLFSVTRVVRRIISYGNGVSAEKCILGFTGNGRIIPFVHFILV